MKNRFSDRKKQKLYREWVENSGLPSESVPEDAVDEASFEAGSDNESVQRQGRLDGHTVLAFRLTMRHLLYLVLIVVALLITTVSLATILAMRSC